MGTERDGNFLQGREGIIFDLLHQLCPERVLINVTIDLIVMNGSADEAPLVA
jgi:hypothetical protein